MTYPKRLNTTVEVCHLHRNISPPYPSKKLRKAKTIIILGKKIKHFFGLCGCWSIICRTVECRVTYKWMMTFIDFMRNQVTLPPWGKGDNKCFRNHFAQFCTTVLEFKKVAWPSASSLYNIARRLFSQKVAFQEGLGGSGHHFSLFVVKVSTEFRWSAGTSFIT